MRYAETLSRRLAVLTGEFRKFSYNRHYHEAYVVGILTAGRVGMFYCGAHHIGNRGDVVLISAGELHDGFTIDDDGWDCEVLYLDVEMIHRLSGQSTSSTKTYLFPTPFVRDRQIYCILESAIARLARSEKGEVVPSTQSEALFLIGTAFQLAIERFANASRPRAGRSAIVSELATFMDENFRDGITLSELESVAGMDRCALIKRFKRAIGMPPHQYLMMKRAQGALADICRGNALIDVAFDNGFADQSHMCRVLKKFAGIKPSQVKFDLPDQSLVLEHCHRLARLEGSQGRGTAEAHDIGGGLT